MKHSEQKDDKKILKEQFRSIYCIKSQIKFSILICILFLQLLLWHTKCKSSDIDREKGRAMNECDVLRVYLECIAFKVSNKFPMES